MVDDYHDYIPLHCDWCGVLMGYKETATSEFVYTGTNGGIVHLCYEDRLYVSEELLDEDDQLASDKVDRDTAFHDYIATAINPETSEQVSYPWY